MLSGGDAVNVGLTVSVNLMCGVDRLPALSSPQTSAAEHVKSSGTVPDGVVRNFSDGPWTTWKP